MNTPDLEGISIRDAMTSQDDGTTVRITGRITALGKRRTYNGNPWAVLSLTDHHDDVPVVLFPQPYEIFAALLDLGATITVTGRVNHPRAAGEAASIYAQHITTTRGAL